MLFVKALLAFLALPGVVAFAVPLGWAYLADRLRVEQPLGVVVLGVGLIGLGWTIRDFYVAGKGTLAPWSPPTRLVTVGLYRVSRNPMYVSVVLVLLGWTATFWYWPLLVYAACVAVAFSVRVRWFEERLVESRFGAEWDAYTSRVPRWFGRPRREAPGGPGGG